MSPRPPMNTMSGMSVRAEIDLRVSTARTDTIIEVEAFLRAQGHHQAADDLHFSAFGKNIIDEAR